MDKYSTGLDEVFVALADPTRRAVVRRLGRGNASVGELALEHPMALPSFLKHIRMLERSGLVRTAKHGRVRTCELDRERLAVVDDWLAGERVLWEQRADRLEAFVLAELEHPHPRHQNQPQHQNRPHPDHEQETP